MKTRTPNKNLVTERIFSGYRAGLMLEREKIDALLTISEALSDEPYTTLMEAAADEPFYFDDCMKGAKPSEMLIAAVSRGELFAHYNRGELWGFSILRDIMHEREATWEIWSLPKYRKHFSFRSLALHLVDYAFRPFEAGGLGLRKIKAQVAAVNLPAWRGCVRLGMRLTGASPLDALFGGQYVDMLNFELLNPVFFKDLLNVGRQEQNTDDTAVRAPSAVHPATISTGDDTSSDIARGDNSRRKPDRRLRQPRDGAGRFATQKPKSKRSGRNR